MTTADKSRDELCAEIENLRSRLDEAQQTLSAIGRGEVDSFVAPGHDGDRLYTLNTADRPYRLLVETMNEGAATLAGDGTILYCNRRLSVMLETSLEQLIGTQFVPYVIPSHQPLFMAQLEKGSQERIANEIIMCTTKNNHLPVLVSSSVNTLSGNRELCVVVTDITQQKSLKLLEGILQTALDGFWLLNADKCILDVNDSYCQMSGYRRQELVGMHIKELEVIDSEEVIVERGKKILECGGDIFDSRHRRKDGSVFHVGVSIKYLPLDGGQFAVFVRDITERKLAEMALQQSNATLQAAMDCSSAGIAIADAPDGKLRYVNDSGLLIRGGDRQSVVNGIGIDQYVPSWKMLDFDGKPLRTDEVPLARAITFGETNSREFIIRRSEDDDRIVFANAAPIKDEAGKVSGGIVVFTDITERKKIEEVQSYLLNSQTLPQDEDFFESLARYLANTLGMDYVCIDSLHGDCLSAKTLAVYHDGKFEDNVEYTLKDTPCGDVVGKEVCVFPREVCRLFPKDEALQDLQAESYVGTTLWSFDMKPIGLIAVIGRKELTSSYFAESVLKLVSVRAAGELVRRQTNEEKQVLEHQLQHTQKLESLGVLSGGIAHDFNNILAIIIGYCYLTKMDYETAAENIPKIENAAERAAGLCRQMLAYAGKARLTMSQINMRMLVDEMVTMLKATLPQNAEINPDLSTGVPSISGDSSQIRQILMNLIINASEAIGKEHGEIGVSLATTDIKTGQSELDYNGNTIPPGKYVYLEVTDNGCGMDEETKWRIFEPFYTTKFTGRGLGMSAVLGIIKSHGGALQFHSKLGQGTTFKVYLPVPKSDSAKDEDSNVSILSTPWRVSGTILLVEDEDQVRLIAKALLKNFGFTVLEAVNGKEALELYQRNATDITLVMTDMGMPIMDGYELISELKKLNPELPIIVSSGYGDAEVGSRLGTDNIAGLISKPCGPAQLREVLKRALDGIL